MNTDTGRLYETPTLALVKQQHLVDAPYPNERQVRRRKIMPNEPCPCGSGKKFKKCCRRHTCPSTP